MPAPPTGVAIPKCPMTASSTGVLSLRGSGGVTSVGAGAANGAVAAPVAAVSQPAPGAHGGDSAPIAAPVCTSSAPNRPMDSCNCLTKNSQRNLCAQVFEPLGSSSCG